MASNTQTHFKFDIKTFKIFGNIALTEKMTIRQKIYVVIMLSIVTLQAISNIVGLYMNWDNFQHKVDNFLMTNVFITIGYELYNFIFYREESENLIRQIDSTLNDYQVFFCKEKYVKSFLGRFADNIDKMTIVLVVCLNFTSVVWLIMPILTKSGALPFKHTWYPFDAQEYYFYIYVFQILADFFGGSNGFMIYFFYNKISAIICEQFNILEHSLKHLTLDDDKVLKSEEVFERIKKCMKFHAEILK